MRTDKQLKADCIAWLESQGDGPAEPIATLSFSRKQAALAERCEPAKTRGEQWAERARQDEQIELFERRQE